MGICKKDGKRVLCRGQTEGIKEGVCSKVECEVRGSVK